MHVWRPTVPDISAALLDAFAGRYVLQRELCTGPLAVDHLAEEASGRRTAVVSVLRPEVAGAIDADRVVGAQEPARRLRYPNIEDIAEAGRTGPFLYWARRHSGESVRERIQGGPMHVTDTVRVAWDVVDALSFAHDEGVLHLGLRPECIGFSTRHVMLAELGIAAAARDAGLASAGVPFAASAYLAPEVAAGEPGDVRSDVYAVGAVAYELLLGRPPGEDAISPVAIADERPAVPPTFAQLVSRCLQLDPAARWQSAHDLLPQLAALASLGRVSVGARRPHT